MSTPISTLVSKGLSTTLACISELAGRNWSLRGVEEEGEGEEGEEGEERAEMSLSSSSVSLKDTSATCC